MQKLSDSKVALSTKLYDLIDEHMKVANKHMNEIENVMVARKIPFPSVEPIATDDGKRKRSINDGKTADAEPLYCICRQVQ